MYDSSYSWWKVALIALAVLVLLGSCVGFYVARDLGTVDHVSGHITNSYVKNEGNSGVYYIVLQKDDGSTEVFQDTDSALQGKWNSSDVFAQLTSIQKNNQHVTLRVAGWRIPFLSMYRNVLAVEHVDNQ